MKTDTLKTTLIAMTTQVNLLRGSTDYAAVHKDFVNVLNMLDPSATLCDVAEAEAFHEVLRRRGLTTVLSSGVLALIQNA